MRSLLFLHFGHLGFDNQADGYDGQVTRQRRLGVWAGWPAIGAMMLFGEAFIKHSFPDDPNHLLLSTNQLLGYCAFLTFIFAVYYKYVSPRPILVFAALIRSKLLI